MFRRKTMPADLVPAWERFLAQADRVEKSRRALLGCLPVGRVDPAPVPLGLALLRDELAEVRAGLDEWRVPQVEAAWQSCRQAVDEALAGVPRADEVARTSRELQELLDAVTEVTEPLDAWAEAERAWLRLRARSPR